MINWINLPWVQHERVKQWVRFRAGQHTHSYWSHHASPAGFLLTKIFVSNGCLIGKKGSSVFVLTDFYNDNGVVPLGQCESKLKQTTSSTASNTIGSPLLYCTAITQQDGNILFSKSVKARIWSLLHRNRGCCGTQVYKFSIWKLKFNKKLKRINMCVCVWVCVRCSCILLDQCGLTSTVNHN